MKLQFVYTQHLENALIFAQFQGIPSGFLESPPSLGPMLHSPFSMNGLPASSQHFFVSLAGKEASLVPSCPTQLQYVAVATEDTVRRRVMTNEERMMAKVRLLEIETIILYGKRRHD